MIFGKFKKKNPRAVGFFRWILDRNVVVTTLVVPQIPDNIPLLMDIMRKLAKLKFEDFDTQLQEGLKRADCLIPDQPDPSQA